jgi:hypothetical protein
VRHQCAGYLQVQMHNEGGVWTALVSKLPKKGILYAYCVDGPGGWDTGYRWVDMQRVRAWAPAMWAAEGYRACAAQSCVPNCNMG